jgi:hypothetical protein
MFDPVTAKLLQTAPPLEDLDPNDLPSMLTRQYAELVARRLRGAGVGQAAETAEPRAWPLSRIADAYEIVTSIHGDPAVRRAAAFVAATANQILARQADVTEGKHLPILDRNRVDPSISAAVLFLAAEQYADAHEAAAAIDPSDGQSHVTRILAEHLRDLARGNLKSIVERGERWRRPGADRDNLDTRALNALYESLATGVEILAAFLLREPMSEVALGRFDSARAAFARVLDLSRSSAAFTRDLGGEIFTTYPGPRHLAALLMATCDGIEGAALTRIPPPAGSDTRFWGRWLAHRSESAPFVWPNHRIATEKGFHEGGKSAVMVLPTGAGKTTISGLKIAGVLARGKKVVFLVPTHALVDQLTEDLQQMFPKELIGSIVSSDFDLLFAAGSQLQQIEVITPERCLALLSFAPDAFGEVGLLVFDECHLLSPKGGNLRRALDGMFCVLAFNSLAPTADFLFLSAMLRNGEQFSRWIGQLTGRPCVFVDPLWKPSRQARGVVLYERSALNAIKRAALAAQRAENRRVGKTAKELRSAARKELFTQPFALFGLQHNWLLGAEAICTIAKISGTPVHLEGKPTTHGIGIKPNVNHVAAQLAAAAVRSGLKAIIFVNVKSHAVSTANEIAQLLGDTPIATEDEAARWDALKNELGGLEHSVLPGPSGAVPHNAMMLRLERDLAERLFRRPDGARAIVATPTLAQGLNLPAHIAILAGDKRADPEDGGREALEAHEILNAAARAGRAGHLANGVVLLIPEDVLDFGTDKSLSTGLITKLKSILPEDDRCVEIEDPLQTILDRITVHSVGDLDVEYALNRLSTVIAPEGAKSEAVARFDIARSFAAFTATENLNIASFEARIARLNEALAARNDPPNDAALLELAAQSGAPLPVLVNLRRRLKVESKPPITIEEWVCWIIQWLSDDEHARRTLLEREKRSILGAVGLPQDRPLSADALQRLRPGVLAWIKGEPMNVVEKELGGNLATAAGKLCPRARTLATNIAPLGLSFIAGLVARAAKDAVATGDVSGTSAAFTDCLATAVRRGFDSPEKVAFAELRTGILSRVNMHEAFAAQVGERISVSGDDDYAAVKAKVEAII